MSWNAPGGGNGYGNLDAHLNKKIYGWFLFSGKALTWDILCSKGREGPRRCYLCKMESKSNAHIGFECSLHRCFGMKLMPR